MIHKTYFRAKHWYLFANKACPAGSTLAKASNTEIADSTPFCFEIHQTNLLCGYTCPSLTTCFLNFANRPRNHRALGCIVGNTWRTPYATFNEKQKWSFMFILFILAKNVGLRPHLIRCLRFEWCKDRGCNFKTDATGSRPNLDSGAEYAC